MRTQRHCLPLLILALTVPSSVHASCETLFTSLERINTQEKESYKKARFDFVLEKCGHESQSWLDGAAGSRRFQYLNCKISAQSSQQFKSKWAISALAWQAKRESTEAALLSSGCTD